MSPTKRKGTEHWGFLFESGLAADWCGRVEKRRLYHKKKDKIQGAVKCRKEVDSHCSQASWLLVVSRVWRSGLVTLIGKQDETADDERRERALARAERAACMDGRQTITLSLKIFFFILLNCHFEECFSARKNLHQESGHKQSRFRVSIAQKARNTYAEGQKYLSLP